MIIVSEIIWAGGACPFQVEGKTDKGELVYARYRSGKLSVRVNDEVVFFKQIGKDQNDEEVIAHHRAIGMEEDQVKAAENMFKKMRQYMDIICFDGYMDMTQLREATVGEIQWPDDPCPSFT